MKKYTYSCPTKPKYDCGCIAIINTKCIDYYGPALSNIDVSANTHTTLETILSNINTSISQAGGPIEITYSELLSLYENEQLVPGQEYIITNYRTLHDIFNIAPSEGGGYVILNTDTQNEGPVAPLLVKAKDQFELYPEAICLKTNHTVLYSISGSLPYSGSLETTGLIYRRIDMTKNVSLPGDWYVYIWQINGTPYRPLGGQWFPGDDPFQQTIFYGNNIFVADQQEYGDIKPVVFTSNSVQTTETNIGPGLGFAIKYAINIQAGSLSQVFVPNISISNAKFNNLNATVDFVLNTGLFNVNGTGAYLTILNSGDWDRYTNSLVLPPDEAYGSVSGVITYRP